MAGADEWQRLWAPERMRYIAGVDRPPDDGPGEQCPFCRSPADPPAETLVVARGELVYAVLNKYPYNPGHLLICPYRHVAEYVELESDEAAEFTAYTRQAIRSLTEVSNPQGFNIGMNQGSAAGAGVAGHLHQHVVPRWAGDTNFMPVVGGTKVLPQLLSDTKALLAVAWNNVKEE